VSIAYTDTSIFKFAKPAPRSVVKIVKDRAAKAQETRTRKKVDKRDKHRCFYPNCRIPACHKHHQIYRSKGGTWTADNIVSGCNKHHRWVHDGLIRLVGNPDKPPLGVELTKLGREAKIHIPDRRVA
jgi:hypothetical protein